MRQRMNYLMAVAGTALVLALAGCGGGGGTQASGTASRSASSAAATTSASAAANGASAEIATNWAAFFDGKTPAQHKVTLLQNGDQFAQLIQRQGRSALAQSTTAQVSKVSLTDAHTAAVTYTVLLGGQPALKDQTGTALLIDGTWKVSDQSFCALLSLQGTTPPMCPAASPSATASSSG